MSRRTPPSDTFTRFTSNTPYASRSTTFSSRPPISRQTADPQQPLGFSAGPEGETAAEKVARLRNANRLAKERAQLSATDRIIARGRLWADIAHRATTYGLLIITGVSSVVAVYGLVSLVSHNRRQKRAWIEREMDRLHEARSAFLRGEADAEQLHLLEQERAGEEMAQKYKQEKERRKAEGVFGRIKGTFGNFLGHGDKGTESAAASKAAAAAAANSNMMNAQSSNSLSRPDASDSDPTLRPVAVQQSNIPGVGLDDKGRPVPINKLERVINKVESERRTGEKAVIDHTGITGGPLDVLANNAANAVTTSSTSDNKQSWWGWATGSKSS